MKKKTIWTIELPDSATNAGRLRVAISNLGGKIVDIKAKFAPLTNRECQLWCDRWMSLPDTTVFATSGQRHKTMYSVTCSEGKLKVGVAKCHHEDTFNFAFGRALADARAFGDRKLERALLRFTPEQIKKYF